MDATRTTSRRQTSRTLIVVLFLCVAGVIASILLAQQTDLTRVGDWVSHRKRTKIVLYHIPIGTTGRVEGWVGGNWTEVEGKLKIIGGGNELDLKAGPTGLIGTANGMPVSCRNLTIESGTGTLTVDDPELLARIGTTFDLRAEP